MAEGILRKLAGDRFEVFSAGTAPRGIHPKTIEVMRELGIDVSSQTSKGLDVFLGREFDYVITVCDRARQNCPAVPGSTSIHWGFDDPVENTTHQLEAFRRVRDEISQRIRLFLLANKE
jgi:arsenate reductase